MLLVELQNIQTLIVNMFKTGLYLATNTIKIFISTSKLNQNDRKYTLYLISYLQIIITILIKHYL